MLMKVFVEKSDHRRYSGPTLIIGESGNFLQMMAECFRVFINLFVVRYRYLDISLFYLRKTTAFPTPLDVSHC